VAVIWKDITSYSRNEQTREPRTWEARAGHFRLIITKGHIHHPNEWVLHVYPGLLEAQSIGSNKLALAAAQHKAVLTLRKLLEAALSELS
jgi:hypothetical protein